MKKLRSARRPPRVGGIDAEGSSSGHARGESVQESVEHLNSSKHTQTVQNNAPPSVSSFSQLGTNFNSGFQMRPATPNNAFSQFSQYQAPTNAFAQFQTPTQISNAPQKNAFAFEVPGLMGTQPSAQSSVSSYTATTMTSPDPSTSPYRLICTGNDNSKRRRDVRQDGHRPPVEEFF
ncbi:hypothetical protein Tco_0236750 [Tanacetum coccineum]